jgi:hypothetical protein
LEGKLGAKGEIDPAHGFLVKSAVSRYPG